MYIRTGQDGWMDDSVLILTRYLWPVFNNNLYFRFIFLAMAVVELEPILLFVT